MKKKSFPVVPVVIAVLALSVVAFVNSASVQPQTAGMETSVQETAAPAPSDTKDQMAAALKNSGVQSKSPDKSEISASRGPVAPSAPMEERAQRPQPQPTAKPQKPRVDPNAVSSQWYDEESAVGR